MSRDLHLEVANRFVGPAREATRIRDNRFFASDPRVRGMQGAPVFAVYSDAEHSRLTERLRPLDEYTNVVHEADTYHIYFPPRLAP